MVGVVKIAMGELQPHRPRLQVVVRYRDVILMR